MKDAFDKLADDIKASVKETCAKVAEIHSLPLPIGIKRHPRGSWAEGYNAAVTEIAAKIREL